MENKIQILDTKPLTNSDSLSICPDDSSVESLIRKKSYAPSKATTIYGGTLASAPASLPLEQKNSTPPKPEPVRNSANWSGSLQAVLDQPPASLPLRMMWGGLAFCLTFVAWATFGQIDEVGHARGVLMPKGDVYKIHPIESGKIASIRTKEGQFVKAGQALVELDTEFAQKEVERLQQSLMADKIQLAQTQGMIEKNQLQANNRAAMAIADAQAQESAIAQAKAKAATTQDVLLQLQADIDADRTRLQGLKSLPATVQERVAQLQADVVAHKARLEKIKPLVDQGAISQAQTFAIEQEIRDRQSAITKSHLDEGTSTKERLFEVEQNLRDRQRTLTQNQGELKQSLVEVNRLQALLAQKLAEGKTAQVEAQQQIQQLQLEMTKLKGKTADDENLLSSAKTKLNQRYLYAPVEGIVSSLNIRNIGEVVQTGQTLAEIAPKTAPLVISASLPNQEAGFVKIGMPVQVKLDAYPYQNYGVISGKVTSISPDSKQDKQLGSVYQVEVSLDRHSITANKQTIQFKSGQAATVEIITRRRHISDILLDPIRQLQKGGINL
ncbi:MAG: HlyD family efflux transporter periplasmic adaptor subunit [Coleofasciculaceae cyanobacterium]